jgi:hypothetical protein
MDAAVAPRGAAPEIEKCVGADDVEPDPRREEDGRAAPVPPWRDQVTMRCLVAALLIGFVYTVIIMKLALTTGIIPTLNVSAALLAFLVLRGWTRALGRLGLGGAARPFTRQENTVVQTCAVACYTMGFGGARCPPSPFIFFRWTTRVAACCCNYTHTQNRFYLVLYPGGFGSSLLALNKKTYELAGVNTPGNTAGSYKEPGIGWMTGFLLAISFVGLLNLLPLRKVPHLSFTKNVVSFSNLLT